MNKILYTVGIVAVLITGMIMLINATTEPVIPDSETEATLKCDWTAVEITSGTEPTVDIYETESATEAITEASVAVEENTSSTEKYYKVNLPEHVQDVIFEECEKYSISPSIVIAIIERESKFDTYAMGDDGRSFGLMQIQPKWHLQRMIELNCTDLFNPEQNIRVGINYLAELKDRYGDITKALVAYNRGVYDGTITSYAIEIMARANEV